MRRIPLLICAIALSASCAAPAAAQDASGVYICVDAYGVPLGRLRVDGTDYSWTKINASFEELEASENGSGEVAYDGQYMLPQSGPLARWQVTGAFGPDFVNINNNGGSLMGCRVNY